MQREWLEGIEKAEPLRPNKLRVCGRAEYVLQDPCCRPANKDIRKILNGGPIADIKALEINRVGCRHGVGHDNVHQAQGTGARTGARRTRIRASML